MNPTRTQLVFRILGVALAAGALCLGGCSLLGAALVQTTGRDKVPAQFKIPEGPTLILAESYGNGGGVEIDADHLASDMYKLFKENKVGHPLIDLEKLDRIREANGIDYHSMTIDAIGRSVGAKQIVYVNILRVEVVTPSSAAAIHGVMDARVRVVDSTTGETLWPTDDREGIYIHSETSWTDGETPQEQNAVRDDIAQKTAEGISKFFYAWEPKSETERPGYGE